MSFIHDPDGRRLPIKLDTTTNGEFAPIPLEPIQRHARALAIERAARNAKRTAQAAARLPRVGVRRRDARSSRSTPRSRAGSRAAATTTCPREAALDDMLARSSLDKSEFVFDVQGHFVNPTGAWTKSLPPGAQPLRFATEPRELRAARRPPASRTLQCVGTRCVPQGRVPRLRHRPHRAVVRAVDARRASR